MNHVVPAEEAGGWSLMLALDPLALSSCTSGKCSNSGSRFPSASASTSLPQQINASYLYTLIPINRRKRLPEKKKKQEIIEPSDRSERSNVVKFSPLSVELQHKHNNK